jgi:hypothetical protein
VITFMSLMLVVIQDFPTSSSQVSLAFVCSPLAGAYTISRYQTLHSKRYALRVNTSSLTLYTQGNTSSLTLYTQGNTSSLTLYCRETPRPLHCIVGKHLVPYIVL